MQQPLSRAGLASITDVELAFGTTRLLPEWDAIPETFKSSEGNIYTCVAEAIFHGRALPDTELEFRAEFDDDKAPADLNRCVRAHLASFSPKHEHKIAGIGYLMSLVCVIRPMVTEQEQ